MNRPSLTVAFHTLGCKVNQYETDRIADSFRAIGDRVVSFAEPADVYLVNTCSVTHLADRKSRQMLRRAATRNPRALVVATGCAAETIRTIGIDRLLVVPNREKMAARRYVEEAFFGGAIPSGEPWEGSGEFPSEGLPASALGKGRVFLKVQDGCNRRCTFCLIPSRRGESRSRPIREVVEEARLLEGGGAREIVVTGISLGDYGRDLPESPSLTDLLSALAGGLSRARLRISSIDPGDVDDPLIDLLAAVPTLAPHLHLSLQHASSRVLRRMNRFYTHEMCVDLLDRLEERIPNLAMSADVIVGFPGETEDDFETLLRFVDREIVCRLHVFPYSERPGTAAVRLQDRVPHRVKEERSHRLLNRAEELAARYRGRLLGLEVTVLVEEESGPHHLEGYSENYVRVRIPRGTTAIGRLEPVRIEWSDDRYAYGIPRSP